tara:strand:- start:1612 stop:2025 length:414 start_codon:yes stop_codon:yes gene_type:complete
MKKKHIMELPTNVPRLKEGKTFEQKIREGRLRFNMSQAGKHRKKLEAKAKKEKESKFHDDGAAKMEKDLDDAIMDKKFNPGKFTGKEYLPAIPSTIRGQKISPIPGISTSRPNTIYSGKEYDPRAFPNRKRKKKIAI